MFVKAFVASLLAAQLAFATTCTRSYTVQAGDYCDKISAAQSVSTYQLAALNPSINGGCTNLLPGQVLCLGSSDADCTSVAVVKPGNTCDIISQAANTNNTLLHLNNPQINQGCTNIYVGEVLCVAGSSQVPPAPANVVPAQQVGGGNTPVPQNQGNDNNNGGNNNNNGGNNNNNNNNNNGGDNGNNGDNSDGGDDSQLPFCDEIDN